MCMIIMFENGIDEYFRFYQSLNSSRCVLFFKLIKGVHISRPFSKDGNFNEDNL